MAKRRTLEEDKSTLQKKVRTLLGKVGDSKVSESLRELRKRLKRTQRKIRSRAARIAQAAGKKGKAD